MKNNVFMRIVAMCMALMFAMTAFVKNDNQITASAMSNEKAYFPGRILQVTKWSNDNKSSIEVSGNQYYYAPYSAKVIYRSGNAVVLQSINRVICGDSVVDYAAISMTEGRVIGNLNEGAIIRQNTAFYQSNNNKPIHLSVIRSNQPMTKRFYTADTKRVTSGNTAPSDVFCLRQDTQIVQRGGFAWSKDNSRVLDDMRYHVIQDGGIYTIHPNGRQLYLSESGTRNLSNVNLSSAINNASKWRAKYDYNKRAWYFINIASGRVLDINGQSVKSGQNVQIYDKNNCSTEYYVLKPNGYGAYVIQTSNNRVAIDCYGSIYSLKSGSNVWTYGINYDNTQLFIFTRVSA